LPRRYAEIIILALEDVAVHTGRPLGGGSLSLRSEPGDADTGDGYLNEPGDLNDQPVARPGTFLGLDAPFAWGGRGRIAPKEDR
jgi:hypothetical protein